MTLYIIISTCHAFEMRLKGSDRDTPIKWRDILPLISQRESKQYAD